MRYIEMACPRCGRGLRVRGEYLGRFVICNRCDHGFEVASTAPVEVVAGAEPPDRQAALLGGASLEARADRPPIEPHRSVPAEALREAQDESARLRGEVAALRERLDRSEPLASAAEDLRNELATVRGELEVSRRRAVEADRLEIDLQDARAGIVRLQDERDGLRASSLASAEAAARELDATRDERDRLVAEIRGLRDRLDAATGELERLRERDGQRERLQAEADEQACALDRARQDLGASRAAFERAAEEWRSIEGNLTRSIAEERRRWEEERADLDGLNARLRDQADVLSRELGAAVADRDEAEARCRRLEGELADSQGAVQRYRDERERWLGDLDRAQGLARRQAEQNAALGERNRRHEAELERLARVGEAERQEHERHLDELRRQVEEHRLAWRESLDHSEREAQALREQAEALRAERDEAVGRVRDLERHCEELAGRLESAESDRAGSDRSLRNEIERLGAALAGVSRDRDEAIRLASDLARQAAELQSERDHAIPSQEDEPSGRDHLPVLYTGDGGDFEFEGVRLASRGEDPPDEESHRRAVGDAAGEPVPRALSLPREVRWHMEMNQRIAELNRRRRR